MRLLLVSYIVDGSDVSEPFTAFQWVNALGRHFETTLLCLDRPGGPSTAEQLPHVRVISWPEPKWLRHFERFRAMAKPGWRTLEQQSRRWIAAALKGGEQFDIAHQVFPQAMRHASPLRDFAIPYVIGPLGGGLADPPGFVGETPKWTLSALSRTIDPLRLRFDRRLRSSYENAGALIGVAPYVRQILGDLKLRRFETMVEQSATTPLFSDMRSDGAGTIRLLHVGRCVRTKGLRDAVRALARLKDRPGVTLTSAGDGPDLAACRAEAQALGVADRVTFLGQVSRDQVEQLYSSHDVFCFPSFREPMGGVFFEALRWGLPVISARRGGPEAIVDEHCGILVPVETPDQYAGAIADAVRTLADDPALRARLGNGAHHRLQSFGTWADKAAWLETLYREVIAAA